MKKLELEVGSLQKKITGERAADVAKEEYERRITSLEEQVRSFRDDVLIKDAMVDARTKDVETLKAEAEDLKMQISELQSQAEVFKAEAAIAKPQTERTEAEIEALNSKISLLESTLENKRKEADASVASIKKLELQIKDLTGDKASAEKEAADRLAELDSIQGRIAEIKQLDQQIHDLQKELKDTKERVVNYGVSSINNMY